MRNISLRRLGMVLRRQRPGKVGITIYLGVFTLMFIVFRIMESGFDNLSEDMLRKGASEWIESAWHIAPNLVCIATSNAFLMLQEKNTAYGYLMLPATMQEKFLAPILITTVGSIAGIIVSMVMADVLCSLLYYVLEPTAWVSGLPELWHLLALEESRIDGHIEWLGMLDSLSFYLWWHSASVFCGAVFRKNALIFSCMVLLPLIPLLWIRSQLATEVAGGLYDSWTLPIAIVVAVLSCSFYIAAYRLFPRRTLVGHKTLAIL